MSRPMQNSTKKIPAGFTLIELIFAMATFTTMLLIAVAGFVNILYIYNQAGASRDNQAQARNIMEQVGRDVRFGTAVKTSADGKTICIAGSPEGFVSYSLNGGGQLLRASWGGTDCVPSGASKVLNTDATKVTDFYTKATPATTSTAVVTIRLVRSGQPTTFANLNSRQFSADYVLTTEFAAIGGGS